MKDFIKKEIFKLSESLERVIIDESLLSLLEECSLICVNSLRAGGKILIAGNGGSAADAQHMAGELVSRLNFNRGPLPAMALTTDTSVLTAIGNDYGFENIFSRQLEGIGSVNDIFWAYSTSGNSRNIISALQQAHSMGITSIGFTGNGGGRMDGICNFLIKAPSLETPKIQELHLIFGHILCGLIEKSMFPHS
jgi:D-sedoheptulose 7-phosphate isomerase